MEKKLIIAAILLSGMAASGAAQNTYEDCIREAYQALASDSLILAEQRFEEALRLEPKKRSNVIVYAQLGDLRQMRCRYEEALHAYTFGLELQSTNGQLLSKRANLYLQLDNTEAALSDYDRILQLHPQQKEALYYRAYCFAAKHDYASARRDYETLLQLEPTHENALLGLVRVNHKDGRENEAMDQLNKWIALNPDHVLPYVLRAEIETERKYFDAAEYDLTKAIELDETNPERYVMRAEFYLSQRRKSMARKDLDKALSLGYNRNLIAILYKKSY
jgi:tetratricopeptide (TPR) repeat protein